MTENTAKVVTYTERLKSLYETFCDKAKNLRGSAESQLQSFRRTQEEVVRKASRNYERLHADFRGNASNAFYNFRKQVLSYKHNNQSKSE